MSYKTEVIYTTCIHSDHFIIEDVFPRWTESCRIVDFDIYAIASIFDLRNNAIIRTVYIREEFEEFRWHKNA